MYRAFFYIFKACPTQASYLFLVTCIQGLSPSVNVFLTGLITEHITNNHALNSEYFYLLLSAWAVTLIGVQILQPLENLFRGNVSELCTKYFNLAILDKLNEFERLLPFDDAEKHQQIEFLRKEAAYRPLNFIVTTSYLTRIVITIISVSVVLFSYSAWVAVIMMVSMLPLLYLNIKVEEGNWKALTSSTKEAIMMKYIFATATNAQNLQDIRAYNMQDYLHDKYASASDTLHTRMKAQRLSALWLPIPAILISFFGLLYALIYFTSDTPSTTQSAISAAMIVVIFQSIIILRESLNSGIQMTSNLFTLTKFFNLFHAFISEVIDDKTNNEIAITPRKNHSISVNAVTFKYAGQAQPVLNGLTFNINAGEKVAIVGDNGSGKSTFVKLLLGFYTPTSGCIEVDGKDLSTLNLRSLRANIASVFQNFGQYHTSPFENIAIEEYAKASEADKQRIKALLALVELDIDVDAKLGKEFDGKDLSGGMWQKLAVARALHKSTKNQDIEPTGLLVLDEFSSALDPIIEKKLFSQLLAQAATIIVITHRLYNLNAFDSIIVFDNGRIIESGNFDALIEKRGRFYQMWQAQNTSCQ